MPISRLSHTRTGSGDPIVLIHGIGHRREAWDPIVPLLAERHEVFTVDLAGFGISPPYPTAVPYNMDNAARDLSENFAEWGITRPHIVGNSLGGAIALELGLRGHAESVTGLSPAGFFGMLGRIQAVGMLLPLRLVSFLPLFLLRTATRHEFVRSIAGWPLYLHPERLTGEQLVDDAISMRGSKGFVPTILQAPHYSYSGQPPVPTTIAWGEHDRVLNIDQVQVAKEKLPHARHVRLPGCGHVPMIDDPELVARVVLETVNRAEARLAR